MSALMIEELYSIIEDRDVNRPRGSYTVELLEGGDNLILKKLGEEAIEVILAARGEGDQRLVEEAADLLYHLMVLLVSHGLHLSEVQAELRRRHLLEGAPEA